MVADAGAGMAVDCRFSGNNGRFGCWTRSIQVCMQMKMLELQWMMPLCTAFIDPRVSQDRNISRMQLWKGRIFRLANQAPRFLATRHSASSGTKRLHRCFLLGRAMPQRVRTGGTLPDAACRLQMTYGALQRYGSNFHSLVTARR